MIRRPPDDQAANPLPFWPWAGTVAFLLCVLRPCACVGQISEPASVEGLRFKTISTNLVLTWPSDPRETFAVLWRSNAALETPWIVLSSQLRAASDTNQTTFRHAGALALAHPSATNSGPSDLYRVFVIPDFWFDMEGITLTGGPNDQGEDFLPFYYGTREVGFFKPATELLVDGQPAGVAGTLDEDVQRVNFGTANKPQWVYAVGFWFHHDDVADGQHTLQIQSSCLLNSFVGQWSQSVPLTNRPIRVRIVTPRQEQEAKGAEGLRGSGRAQAQLSWWARRLGPGFVRKRPSPQEAEEHFVHSEPSPLLPQTQPRPWRPVSPAGATNELTR